MHDMVEGVAGPIVHREFRYEKSPWGLVMNDMGVERRGEHVVQPFADGATGWLVWEVSPSLSYRLVKGNVLHHRGDHGVKACSVPVRGITEWPPRLLWA